jgi:hypothetical protein
VTTDLKMQADVLVEVLQEAPDALTLEALACRVLANPSTLTGGIVLARALKKLDFEDLVISDGILVRPSRRALYLKRLMLVRRRLAKAGEMNVTTLRIEDDLNDDVIMIARVDEVPASEVHRAALSTSRSEISEPQTLARLREILTKETEVLKRLAIE